MAVIHFFPGPNHHGTCVPGTSVWISGDRATVCVCACVCVCVFFNEPILVLAATCTVDIYTYIVVVLMDFLQETGIRVRHGF